LLLWFLESPNPPAPVNNEASSDQQQLYQEQHEQPPSIMFFLGRSTVTMTLQEPHRLFLLRVVMPRQQLYPTLAASAADGGRRRRPFTSTTTSSSSSSSSSSDIVPGPRLLRTSNRHRPRPSLLHLPGLRALPFWTKTKQQQQQQQPTSSSSSSGSSNNNNKSTTLSSVVAYQDATVTRVVQHLEQHCDTIRREYEQVAYTVASDYQADTEHDNKLHQGQWDWRSYMRQGKIEPTFATQFPQTARILNELNNKSNNSKQDDDLLFDGTPFGYAFFSTLHPHSSIQAHCAPMNLRLRVHLPLVVPTTTTSTTANDNTTHRPACGIRVGPVTREWHAGHALVLDDSFEHEVWNETAEERVVLLVRTYVRAWESEKRRDSGCLMFAVLAFACLLTFVSFLRRTNFPFPTFLSRISRLFHRWTCGIPT